jgi:cytochrome c
MSKCRNLLIWTALATGLAAPALAEKLGIGRPALPEEITAWDVNVMPDGEGLPVGGMSVEDGELVFLEKCAACHGDFAEGLNAYPALAGGRGTLTNARPVKTVGSYWPYVSTVWDYVHRTMPFGGAQTVTADEAYGITAYILYSEDLVDYDFTLTNENFTEVRLPNEGGFYVDDRLETEFPAFSAEACMSDCKEAVEITRKASDLKVTPMNEEGKPAGTIPNVLAMAAAEPTGEPAAEPAADAAPAEAAAAPAEAPAAEAPAATAPDPELVAAGERVFRQCQACHKLGEGARNGTGPALNGVFGHPAGKAEGFRYSPALTEAAAGGLVWTEESLDAFLEKPRDFLKGTRMTFGGLRKPEDRAAIIAYLATFAE